MIKHKVITLTQDYDRAEDTLETMWFDDPGDAEDYFTKECQAHGIEATEEHYSKGSVLLEDGSIILLVLDVEVPDKIMSEAPIDYVHHDFMFETAVCPYCGEFPTAVFERIEALAGITVAFVSENKAVCDYMGETEHLWETQAIVEDEKDGKRICSVRCEYGHMWETGFETDFQLKPKL